MYLYITTLLLCIQANFSKTDGCFYEDFMDGKYSALSDPCPEFADNPWRFETYGSAKMNQPSFSTAEGFIGAGELDKQCVTNNFPLNMKEGSELFVAYRATGEAVLSVELIDFHTSVSVDFIIMDLIYDQWSLDSFTIMENGYFTFKIIAFTPERSTLIIDSVTYVNNSTNLDSCMYDDGNDYDFNSVEEPPMDKVESEIDDIKEVADNSQHENNRDTDMKDDVNEDVMQSEDMKNDALEEERFVQDVANSVGDINGSSQDKTNGTEDKNDGVENDNQELENSSVNRDSNNKEDINQIQQDNDETQEEVGPNNNNAGIVESKLNDYIQEDMRNFEEINDSNEVSKDSDSSEDDKDATEKIKDESQSNTYKDATGEIKDESQSNTYNDATGEINDESKQVFEHKDFQEAEDKPLDVNDDIEGSPDNGNNVSNEKNNTSEDNTFENDMNENEIVEFEEIPEDFYDINEDDIDADDINSEDDADRIKEDIEDLQKMFDDEINDVEVESTNFFKDEKEGIEKIENTDFFKDEKEEIVRNFDDEDVLESSQPFSERMPVGAEWFTFLSVVGVVLSIACLLVIGAVLLITKRRAKKLNDYPYYHYEIPHATQKSKNDTFPIYSSA